MTITRLGTCPGIRSGENEVQAWQRQRSYYGPQRAHRVFFPETLGGTESGSAQRARELVFTHIPVSEDIVLSCRNVGSEFPDRVEELRERRAAPGAGSTRLIIVHEPEQKVTVAEYNALWDAAQPALTQASVWLKAGTCHTGYWSRKVDSAGVRLNDWRNWIPTNPAVQHVLKFVSVDLYPSAGRPTRSKPMYYEPPTFHESPYGFGLELGFCGILDEMLEELRSEDWPDITPNLEGGIAEINHSRPTSADGWPSSFADTDPEGVACAAWLRNILEWSDGRYAFVTYFHKGGGDLMLRDPAEEALELSTRIRETYIEEEPVETPEQAYARGVADGRTAGKLEEQERIVGLLNDPLLAHMNAVTTLGTTVEALGNAIEAIDDQPPTPA